MGVLMKVFLGFRKFIEGAEEIIVNLAISALTDHPDNFVKFFKFRKFHQHIKLNVKE